MEKADISGGRCPPGSGRVILESARPGESVWYRPRSVRMPVAPSSQRFESTCPGNLCTKVCIAIQPVVGQHRDRVRWNQPVEGN